MRILIRETAQRVDGSFIAEISFDDAGQYPIDVSDPFDPDEEARLAWYFEEWLSFPFTDRVQAAQAAASVEEYGHRLFRQIFEGFPDVLTAYKFAVRDAGGFGKLHLQIAGSPAFHALHWEALKDPMHPRPFAVEAPLVRKNLTPPNFQASLRPSPTLNVLLVTARPGGRGDVSYRTISRPLVTALRESRVRAQIDLVRPGTWEALVRHLDESRAARGDGYYQLIHFDLHGSLLDYPAYTRLRGDEAGRTTTPPKNDEAGRTTTPPYIYRLRPPRLAPFDGQRAFLFFDGPVPGQAEAVAAEQVADLLQSHQLPIAVLNACQSAMQSRPARFSETWQVSPTDDTSLGSRLMAAGVQLVVGMGYSVTVSAAQLLMTTLYRRLLDGRPLHEAIRAARLELYQQRARRAAYDQSIDLADWLLPVVYENRPVQLRPAPFADAQAEADWYTAQASRYAAPPPAYGFVGRDVDILELERGLLGSDAQGRQRNICLVQGMGGAGKSTLLRHLMEWWQTTGLVEQVVYCGYDERAWSLEQVLDQIGRALYADNFGRERLPDPRTWQAKLTHKLRSERHLLVLDNLESITGAALAIRHLLDEGERAKLRDFVAGLAGGRSLVLLGSRGPERWLTDPATAWRYELPGLDPEAATALAERILERYGVAHLSSDPAHSADLRHLLALLDGHPLALEVVLANLRHQTPGAVLEALQAGDEALDSPTADDGRQTASDAQPNTQYGIRNTSPDTLLAEKTSSILRCIEYSHSNLSPEAQALLACLAPFTGALNSGMLEVYSAKLREEPALAGLPYERWPEVLQEAVNWGLLTPFDVAGNQYLRIQPIFPYFLRNRLNPTDPTPALPAAGRGLIEGWMEGDPTPALPILGREPIEGSGERSPSAPPTALPPQRGELEGGGLRPAIERAFHRFYDDFGAALAQLITSKEAPQRRLGQALIGVEYENLMTAVRLALGDRALFWGAFNALEEFLDQTQDRQRRLELCRIVLDGQDNYNPEQMDGQIGVNFYLVFERLATSNLMLKQYAAAQKAYEDGLALIQQLGGISAEARGNYSAIVYHQLGMVAEEQRRWEEAESHYRQALALQVEFNDRYSQASTYHQMGRVAQEQRRWEEAESHYRQALALFVEFNDRYSQGSTYNQLGALASAQELWSQAAENYLQAVGIAVEFQDEYRLGTRLQSLGRVWQASGDGTIPVRVGALLGVSAGEAGRLLGGDNE